MALVTAVYTATDQFPKAEIYGLQSQIRRAAVSIPSNIAEGAGTRGHRAFARYLRIAYGSACELETQVVVARNLSMLDEQTAAPLLGEIDGVRRMLHGLINAPIPAS